MEGGATPRSGVAEGATDDEVPLRQRATRAATSRRYAGEEK